MNKAIPTQEEKIYSILMDNYNVKEWNKVIKKYVGSRPDVGDVYDLAVKFWKSPSTYKDIYNLITTKYGKGTNS